MRYYSAPRRALRGVRQLLYPRRCPFCNAVLGSIRTCPDCAEEVDRLRRKPGIRLDASQHYLGGLSGAAAPFRYEGCVRRAILRAKYQAAPWTAVELGVVLAELAFGSEVRMRGAEPTVLVVDLNTSITQRAAFAGQGQASFLGIEGTVRSGNHGVEHHRYAPAEVFIHKDDDAFAYANHVGGHAHAP